MYVMNRSGMENTISVVDIHKTAAKSKKRATKRPILRKLSFLSSNIVNIFVQFATENLYWRMKDQVILFGISKSLNLQPETNLKLHIVNLLRDCYRSVTNDCNIWKKI